MSQRAHVRQVTGSRDGYISSTCGESRILLADVSKQLNQEDKIQTERSNKYVSIVMDSHGYVISYYDEKVQSEIAAFPKSLRTRYFLLADRMKIYGPNLGEPHTKGLGDGLFELRLKGAEGIARVCYCTLIGRRIVMLHGFVKKSNKMPRSDLNVARSQMKEIKNAQP